MNEKNEQVLEISLTLDEVNMVLTGLGEMPAKASMAVIQKLQSQVMPQLQQAGETPEVVEA